MATKGKKFVSEAIATAGFANKQSTYHEYLHIIFYCAEVVFLRKSAGTHLSGLVGKFRIPDRPANGENHTTRLL